MSKRKYDAMKHGMSTDPMDDTRTRQERAYEEYLRGEWPNWLAILMLAIVPLMAWVYYSTPREAWSHLS